MGLIRVFRRPKFPLRRNCIRRREYRKFLIRNAIAATHRGTFVPQRGRKREFSRETGKLARGRAMDLTPSGVVLGGGR
jgi:hypothetical protein